MSINFSSIILAAGKGTRMFSDIPKVLHHIGNKSMLNHILDQLNKISPNINNVVCGYKSEEIKRSISDKDNNINWVYQEEQLGTAHAVMQAVDNIRDNEIVVILFADNPLITHKSILNLIKKHNDYNYDGISLFTTILENPFGYGRILRDKNNNIKKIIEEKDANIDEKNIKEVYPGTIVINGKNLKDWLKLIDNNNAQKEYYLTDLVSIAIQKNKKIINLLVDYEEVMSANNRQQLSQLERIYQKRVSNKLMLSGVTIIDPTRFDIRGSLKHGIDCTIDINVIINGNVVIGNNVYIGSGSIITDSIIGDNVYIKPYSVIDQAVIKSNCEIGPFSNLRPGCILDEQVKIGNFVELKKSNIGRQSKINHLSYIGNSDVGYSTNIGAGTITCNYDGVNKYKTIIGNNVFVGSDSQLIAPVEIADGVNIAAGTTVTKSVDKAGLVISRSKQCFIGHWKRPEKK